MGKKSTPSPPPAPDPRQVTAEQYQANLEAAAAQSRYGAVNRYGPEGSTEYFFERDPATGQKVPVAQVISLTPEQQGLYDRQVDIAGNLADTAYKRSRSIPSGPFNLEGLPDAPSRSNYGMDRDALEKDLYERTMRLMQPDLDLEAERFDQNMANRGLPLGGQAYSGATRQFRDSQDRIRQNIALEAIRAGGAEQNRLFGLDAATRDRALQERLLGRTQDMNELSALLQGSPALAMPSYTNTPTPTIQAPDFQSAYNSKYNADLAAYNAELENRSAFTSGLFGLAGNVLGAAGSAGGFGSLFGGAAASKLF